MKVFLGLDSLTPPRTGIGRYTAALLREYLKISPETLEIVGIHGGIPIDDRRLLEDMAARTESHSNDWRGPWWRRTAAKIPGIHTLWQQWRTWRGRIGLKRSISANAIYHEPNYIPLALRMPCVVTVHDLSHLRYPQYHPEARVRWLERRLPIALDQAQTIVTVSDFSRWEILQHFGLAENKVVTILPGLEARFQPPSERELRKRLSSLGLEKDGYLASVGTLEPRKNLSRLLEAYSCLPQHLRRRYPLVLAGPKGWRTETFWPLIERLQRRGEVRWLGYLTEDDLPAFYAGAAVFVYVSLYEGFGLPVLEAMGCGAPVLTSRDSAMASWAGDCAQLTDAHDVEAIVSALRHLLEDEETRHMLACRGKALATQMTWKRSALKMLALYRRLIT